VTEGVGRTEEFFRAAAERREKKPPVRSRSLSVKRLSKFAFGPFQDASLPLRQTFTGTVDVEVQH